MKIDDFDDDDNASPFPHVWVNGANAEAVAKLRSANGLKGSLKIEGMKNEKPVRGN